MELTLSNHIDFHQDDQSPTWPFKSSKVSLITIVIKFTTLLLAGLSFFFLIFFQHYKFLQRSRSLHNVPTNMIIWAWLFVSWVKTLDVVLRSNSLFSWLLMVFFRVFSSISFNAVWCRWILALTVQLGWLSYLGSFTGCTCSWYTLPTFFAHLSQEPHLLQWHSFS